MRPALLALMLSGCASGPCLFGAETEAGAYACAVRNFGEQAAREMYERQDQCAIAGDPAWLAVNCRTSKAEEPNPIATALSKG